MSLSFVVVRVVVVLCVSSALSLSFCVISLCDVPLMCVWYGAIIIILIIILIIIVVVMMMMMLMMMMVLIR